MLVACCAVWAFSFPAMKALSVLGAKAVPGHSSVFFASLCVMLRFGFAAILLGAFPSLNLGRLSRSELRQGLGLGLFGAAGLILQMDGMSYTHASTAAFLTQGYCVWIPVWIGLRSRRFPGWQPIGAIGLAIAGAALLNKVGHESFRLGRGEIENLLGSMFFAAQILWLERAEFAANSVLRFSFVMFTTMAACAMPVAFALADRPEALVKAFSEPLPLTIVAALTVFCTLVTFLLANRWQREVPATEAGLLYCTEPVFATVVTLFLPQMMSQWGQIDYPNEQLTWNLLLGGGLIIAANVWMQLKPADS